jgi:hypothetical protein
MHMQPWMMLGLSGVLGVHVVLVERGFGFGLVVWMLVVLLFGGFLVIVRWKR